MKLKKFISTIQDWYVILLYFLNSNFIFIQINGVAWAVAISAALRVAADYSQGIDRFKWNKLMN